MEAGNDGEDGARERKPPPRSAALALGGPGAGAGGSGGVEKVVLESSRRPASTGSAIGAPASSSGSGGGGPGGRLRDVGTEAFEQLIAEGHVEETVAGSSPEFRARLEARFGRLPARSGTLYTQIYETISFVDNPSHLTELPDLLSEIGVNIIDAHAFSRKDRFINDFIVECWPIEDEKGLHKVLVALLLMNKGLWSGFGSSSTNLLLPFHTDDCESDINTTLLNIGEQVTSGSCGVLFHGTHAGAKDCLRNSKSCLFRSECVEQIYQINLHFQGMLTMPILLDCLAHAQSHVIFAQQQNTCLKEAYFVSCAMNMLCWTYERF